MRVIGGRFRSRPLVAPRGRATRPTSDRLRETLFDVLGQRIQNAHFLDLYAGSGAVGIEALSRGAASCLFVEQAAPAVEALRKNLLVLDLLQQATVHLRPVRRALQEASRQAHAFDIVFLDPPYEEKREYDSTLKYFAEQHETLLRDGSLVIAEHARRYPLPAFLGLLVRQRVLEQGDAALSFYVIREELPAAAV